MRSKVAPAQRTSSAATGLTAAPSPFPIPSAPWVATDWPIGALGAGYLLTAHMIQYVAYSLVIAPLLLRGTPRWMRELVLDAPGMGPLRALTERPFLAFVVFNVVLAAKGYPEAPVRAVFTLRPEFLGRLSQQLAGEGAVRAVAVLRQPPEGAQREALQQQARVAGYRFDDPELPARMVAELRGAGPCLPLPHQSMAS